MINEPSVGNIEHCPRAPVALSIVHVWYTTTSLSEQPHTGCVAGVFAQGAAMMTSCIFSLPSQSNYGLLYSAISNTTKVH
jgi:hypothetical protein